MEILDMRAQRQETAWRVVVPHDIGAMFTQLTDAEQDSVHQLLAMLKREGVPMNANDIADRLPGAEPLYLLRVPGAPDVRLIVRIMDATVIEVEDVVRPKTLRNVFHAHVS